MYIYYIKNAVAECLVYSYKAGLDLDKTIRVLSIINIILDGGACRSFTLSFLPAKMINRDFGGFTVDLGLKDVGITLSEAKKMNMCLPGVNTVYQLMTALKAQNSGDIGMSGLIKVLEGLNGIENIGKKE